MNIMTIFSPVLVFVLYLLPTVLTASIHNDIPINGSIPFPVIIFPGLAGSQLQARLNRTHTAHWYCSKRSDWYRIWLDLKYLLPPAINCFKDNFRLVYNNKTGLTENVPGVEIRVEDYGNVTTLEYFLDFKHEAAGYYHNLISGLEQLGYQRGISIRGASFDFRKAPYESQFTYQNLTRLIEETYVMNGNKPSILICHSSGCTYNYFFLLQKDLGWKNKYIRAWLTLGAPFGGAVEALEAIVTGNNFHFRSYSKTLFRDLERSFSSISATLPISSIFSDKIPLIKINDTILTSHDLSHIYDMLNDTNGKKMWEKMMKITPMDFPFPQVETHCIRSLGLKTLQGLEYRDMKSFPKRPKLVYGPGDETVNQISADVCLNWSNEPNFYTKQYDKVRHLDLVKFNETFTHLVENIIFPLT